MKKPQVAKLVVRAIRSSDPPGRFLKANDDGDWYDIGDKKAAQKTSQALREKPLEPKNSVQKPSDPGVPGTLPPIYMPGYVPTHGLNIPQPMLYYPYHPMIPGQPYIPAMGGPISPHMPRGIISPSKPFETPSKERKEVASEAKKDSTVEEEKDGEGNEKSTEEDAENKPKLKKQKINDTPENIEVVVGL